MSSKYLSECSERLSAVEQMMDQTVLSLLRCFNDSSKQFHPTLFGSSPGPATWRDTAIVLIALNEAKSSMNQKSSDKVPDWPKLLETIRSPKTHASDISYQAFMQHIFHGCLKTMACGAADSILGLQKPDGEFIPFKHREPFSCARILGLLNIYGSQDTHREVYMSALSEVLTSLTTAFPPTYAFGGASISRKEPHAFAAYYCLDSIHGIARQLRERRDGHNRLTAILRKTHDWIRQDDSSRRT